MYFSWEITAPFYYFCVQKKIKQSFLLTQAAQVGEWLLNLGQTSKHS